MIPIHEGHRQRLKKRFLQNGLTGFEDHQALELLLFYAIPRKDTNELAHMLLQKFGDLKTLFAADISDLAKVPGIGEHAALLIKLIPEISSKFWFVPAEGGIRLNSVRSAASYARSLLYGKPAEHFYAICLDARYRVKTTELISKGTPSKTPVHLRNIAEAVFRSGTEKLLLAHNHPDGSRHPSKEDIEATLGIAGAMDALGIKLLDHIIVSPDHYYSFMTGQLLGGAPHPDGAYEAHE